MTPANAHAIRCERGATPKAWASAEGCKRGTCCTRALAHVLHPPRQNPADTHVRGPVACSPLAVPRVVVSADAIRQNLHKKSGASLINGKDTRSVLFIRLAYSAAVGTACMKGNQYAHVVLNFKSRNSLLFPCCVRLVLGDSGSTGLWAL